MKTKDIEDMWECAHQKARVSGFAKVHTGAYVIRDVDGNRWEISRLLENPGKPWVATFGSSHTTFHPTLRSLKESFGV